MTYKEFNEKKMRYKLKKIGWTQDVIDEHIRKLKRNQKQFILDVINDNTSTS
jgi:hypothetical protein